MPEGQLYFEHHDLLGSPVMRTAIDGAVVWKGDYAPFRETLEEQPITWGSQYRFLGNEDDGGLMDFGARFYDPRVGRFISPDPIKDVSSANAVNPYVYCANNPLRYTDKFGLSKAPKLYTVRDKILAFPLFVGGSPYCLTYLFSSDRDSRR